MLEPAEPVVWPTPVRGNDQDFDVSTHLPVKDVIREAWNAIEPNIGGKLDLIAVRSLTNLGHR